MELDNTGGETGGLRLRNGGRDGAEQIGNNDAKASSWGPAAGRRDPAVGRCWLVVMVVSHR